MERSDRIPVACTVPVRKGPAREANETGTLVVLLSFALEEHVSFNVVDCSPVREVRSVTTFNEGPVFPEVGKCK